MKFKEAVEKTGSIADEYCEGLQAIRRSDRARITVQATSRLRGSLNLDSALSRQYPSAPRWDYGVGWKLTSERECVIWIEVHPAWSSNVKEVVAKFDWIRRWLRNEAQHLDALTREKPTFVWIASGAVHISRNSPEFRRLAGSGIQYPCKHLKIDAACARRVSRRRG